MNLNCSRRHVACLTVLLVLCGALLAATPVQERDAKTLRVPGSEVDGPYLEVHDIRDLVSTDDDEEGPRATAKHLCEMIRNHIQPAFAPETENVKTMSPGVVVVVGRPEQQQWVRDFFDLQRRNRDVYFLIEVQLLELDSQAFAELGLGPEPTVIDQEEFDDLMLDVQERGDVDLLTAPRLLSLNGQRVTVTLENPMRYIKGYEVFENVMPGGRTIEVPQIESIREGVVMDGVATLIDDDRIGVDFEIVVTDVKRPLEIEMTEFGEVARPEVSRTQVESKLYMRDGATAVFPSRPATQDGATDEERLVVILTASRP